MMVDKTRDGGAHKHLLSSQPNSAAMSKRDSDSGPSHSNKKRRDEPVDRDADVPESERWGKSAEDKPEIVKDEANFGLSGALSKDLATGNAVNGVVKKYNAPVNEILPNTKWRLYVFKPNPKSPKDAELIDTMHIHRAPHYLLGSDEDMADVCLAHDSISGEHAVLQVSLKGVRERPALFEQRGFEPFIPRRSFLLSPHGSLRVTHTH